MDFLRRAENALERGDPAQALVVLTHGLRRHPERDDAIDLLIYLYTRHFRQPGLESDLFRALEYRDDRDLLLRLFIDELEQGDRQEMARAIESVAASRQIAIVEGLPEAVTDDPEEENHRSEPSAETTAEKAQEVVQQEGDGESTGVSEESHRSAEAPPGDRRQNDRSKPRRRASGAGREGSASAAGASPSPSSAGEAAKAADKKKRTLKAKALLVALVALGVVVAGSVVVVGWQHALDLRQTAAVDDVLFSLDPLAPQPFFEAFEEAESYGTARRRQGVEDRRRFVDALIALEQAEDGARPTDEAAASTDWGLAAQALEATGRGDWEEAMRFSHQLDRAHGDGLPAFFVRARICEARRQWECAAGRYSRVQQHFPEFIAAHLGAMRIAAHGFDADQWERQQGRLADIDGDHPYVGLGWLDPFGNTELPEAVDAEGDRFVARWASGRQALADLRQWRWAELLTWCEDRTTATKAQALPATTMACGFAAAGRVDAPGFVDALEQLTAESMPGRSLDRLIQIHGPPLLIALGRADWALRFAIPFDDDPVEEDDESQTALLVAEASEARPPRFTAPTNSLSEADVRALLARGQALVALGATERGRRTLSRINTRREWADAARFEVVVSHLVDGNRGAAAQTISQIEGEHIRRGADGYLAYMEGRHDEALNLGWQPGADMRFVRVSALGFMAMGRAREALTALNDVGDGLDALALVPVYQRVLARSGERAALDSLREETADDGEFYTLDHLIDLGGAAFWGRDLAKSERLLEQALSLAPDHPEVHWHLGLLRRVQGEKRQALPHFRSAWRGDQDAIPFLVESGQVHLEYGRYEEARRVFLKAVLRERQNLDAVSGLGQAYAEGDRARGRRDLVQLLRNYNGSDEDAPGRAEMHRWLAVLHGSRDGDEEGWQYLERAAEIVGGRTSILAEMAIYYEAREQWERAREMYGQALRLDPTHPEIHLGLGRAARALGDGETARDHLERVIALVPVGDMRDRAREALDELEDT